MCPREGCQPGVVGVEDGQASHWAGFLEILDPGLVTTLFGFRLPIDKSRATIDWLSRLF